MKAKKNFPYLHGFSPDEQDRLRRQARFAEFTVYEDVNLSEVKHVLEVGCGVGAQTEILLRRFPKLKITGIDLNPKQLSEAKRYHAKNPLAKGRLQFKKMNASKMDFKAPQFDGAFLCWILEHLPDPARVLSEVRRVLKPGSKVILTEVMNSSFFLHPYSPHVWKYWMALNDYQYENAGDPFIGAKLGNLLLSQGYKNIRTEVKSWHIDSREPSRRKEFIQYWNELLLSGASQLLQAGSVTAETIRLAKEEMSVVAHDPNAVFFYSFIQAQAEV